MERVRIRGVAAVAGCAMLLALAACSDDSASEPARAPEVDLGFTQLLPEEGSDRALLRVINREREPIEVTAVGLSWPGYGEVLQPTDGVKEVPGESELMLRVQLPPPQCTADAEPPTEPVAGRLTVGGVDLEQPLTDPAQVYVHRLWRTQCDRELLESRVRIEYAGDPRQVSGPGGDAVDTALVLTRVAGDEPLRLTAVGGSVLHDLRLTGRTTLPAGATSTRVPLQILPGNRCDEHAIGQATAPYDFFVTVAIGDREVLHAIVPPQPTRSAASRMLRRHCGLSDPG